MAGKGKMEATLRSIGNPRGVSGASTMIEKWDKALKKFSDVIAETYEVNKESQEELEKKVQIFLEIENYLKNNVFDHSINGFSYELTTVAQLFETFESSLQLRGSGLGIIVLLRPSSSKNVKFTKERCKDILLVILKHINDKKMLMNRVSKDMEYKDSDKDSMIRGIIDGVNISIRIRLWLLKPEFYSSTLSIDAYKKYDRRFILLAAFVIEWQESFKSDVNKEYYEKVFPSPDNTLLLVLFFMKQYKMLPERNEMFGDVMRRVANFITKVRPGDDGALGFRKEEIDAWKSKSSFDVGLGTLFFLFIDFYSIFIDEIARRGKLYLEKVVFPSDPLTSDVNNQVELVSEVAMFKRILNEAYETIKNTVQVELLKDDLFAKVLVSPASTNN